MRRTDALPSIGLLVVGPFLTVFAGYDFCKILLGVGDCFREALRIRALLYADLSWQYRQLQAQRVEN